MKTTTLLGMFALTSVFASGCDCFFGGGSCEETTTAAVATPETPETTQVNNSATSFNYRHHAIRRSLPTRSKKTSYQTNARDHIHQQYPSTDL